MKHNGRILTLLALLALLGVVPAVSGQTEHQPPASSEPQQANAGDPIRQLNLTPEQREQIRSIREGSQAERAAINQRLREANQALDEALDSDSPDEALVEQRMRNLGAAQAAAMRMRILTEVRIRKVLTPEQLGTLRRLRQAARGEERGRIRSERQQQRREAFDGTRSLQNPRNRAGRLQPRRESLHKPTP